MAHELGEVIVLPEGNKWTHGDPAIMVRCKDGWLIAYPSGDPGVYDEISVDLISDDDKLIQLAVVGRDEEAGDFGWPDYTPMHVFSYDGQRDDVAHIQYVTVNDKSMWYSK